MADLIAAARTGDVERVRALVAAEPTLASARDENGLPAVLVALFNGHRPVAEALAEAGAELGVLEAAALGRAGRLRELLAAAPAALAARTPEGFDPIGLAAFLGGSEAVRALLDHGADPDGDPANPLRVRPLHAAAAAQDRESVRLLLAAGADPDVRQRNGFTPLHAAAHHDDAELARMLLAAGADPALETADGRDAARVAADEGSAGVAALLG